MSTAPLYLVAEVLAATGGRAGSLAATHFSGISIDSREIDPGALFVAIKGERFDGHDFVEAAIRNGAAAALVSDAKAGAFEGLPLIVVPDALEGLVALARAARGRSKAKIVAVTGSAGKTTTKQAIAAVLALKGKTHASIRSFNNHWGVPLMLARLPKDAAFGVFEIGMSHAGEIEPLSQLVRPHIAVITTIAPAHLENFQSVADIARAKAEIFRGLETDGIAFINADHAELAELLDAAKAAGVSRVVTYGFVRDANVRIDGVKAGADSIAGHVEGLGAGISLSLGTPGRHRLANATAALCVAEACGADLQAAARLLGTLGAPEGRGAIERLGPADNPLILIDESYNANPASMAAALDILSAMAAPKGKKVLVLGDMLELGAKSGDLHLALKEKVISSGAESVFLVGAKMQLLASALEGEVAAVRAAAVDAIAGPVLNALDCGDIVMIKGSNGVRLGSLVSRIRERFGRQETSGSRPAGRK